jgi:hypothetical protein
MKSQHGRDLTAAELAEMIDEFANCHGGTKDIEAFAEQITLRTHRTLQQKIMGLFVGCIEAWPLKRRPAPSTRGTKRPSSWHEK